MKNNKTNVSDADLVSIIRQHALRNYEQDGWDYLVECWDDASILGEVENCHSVDAAIAKLRKVLKAKDDYRKDIQGSEW